MRLSLFVDGKLLTQEPLAENSFLFSPDGRHVAYVVRRQKPLPPVIRGGLPPDFHSEVLIIDGSEFPIKGHYLASNNRIPSLRFSENGTLVGYGSLDGPELRWNVQSVP